MPWTCFDYPANVLPETRSTNAARGVPPGLRKMPAGSWFSYPASCSSYPADMPSATKAPDAARGTLPAVRRMPFTCFRY
jgi:hypothetical protein